jgi:hypothetical protein
MSAACPTSPTGPSKVRRDRPRRSQHGRSVIAGALAQERVYCQLDRAPHEIHEQLRWSQPNFFLPFDRVGIDPFRQRFEVTLRLEGTMRGTGGLRLQDESCSTTVRELYAAGDAATRELICGGFTGGGSTMRPGRCHPASGPGAEPPGTATLSAPAPVPLATPPAQPACGPPRQSAPTWAGRTCSVACRPRFTPMTATSSALRLG